MSIHCNPTYIDWAKICVMWGMSYSEYLTTCIENSFATVSPEEYSQFIIKYPKGKVSTMTILYGG